MHCGAEDVPQSPESQCAMRRNKNREVPKEDKSKLRREEATKLEESRILRGVVRLGLGSALLSKIINLMFLFMKFCSM